MTTPRQLRHFLLRSGYLAALLVLMYTAAQVTFGWQQVRSVGAMARFGQLALQVFSFVQLSLVLFFALLFTAGNIAQEKDRRTLILLLMTDMQDRELVLGKLWASLLNVGVLIAVSIPAFILVHALGGVTLSQIFWATALCIAAAFAAGSWGALVAFWREKTFQTLAVGVLGMVLFWGLVKIAVFLAGGGSAMGTWLAYFDPYQTLFAILSPLTHYTGLDSVRISALGPVLAMLGLGVVLNLISIARLRVWNPSRFIYLQAEAKADQTKVRKAAARKVWANPVLWREIRTRAYGRKMIVIKLAYFVLAGFVLSTLVGSSRADLASAEKILGMFSPPAFAFIALTIISLMLINAQAVTSLTTERDGKTLELLLVTDISAKEFVFGKLGGSLYNTKELVIVPLALIGWFAYSGFVSPEDMTYLIISFLTLVSFVATLGLHSGLSFDNSRSAIANSLGTIFFLFIGIFIFMMLLVEASSSFVLQFQSFIVFIGVGSIALYASLRHKIPSVALTISAFTLPFLTFYAITSFLLGGTLGVCMVIAAAYGFPVIAMLIPAVSEFDMALGRTTLDQG
jgi:ABC-type transport system involved in multi-copper enzyme maturation permease subunit